MASNKVRLLGVAVDVAVFTVRDGALHVALIQMKGPPFSGRWALPGGRIRVDETVEQAAARELEEKTGVSDVWLEELHTFSDPRRDPQGRCVSVAYLALVPADVQLRTSNNYSAIGWFPADRPPALAFDHKLMLADAVRRLRARLHYTNIAYSLLGSSFTLGELQRVYEAILDEKLDPRNFQRRIQEVGLVQPTGQMRTGRAHRPARLFRFRVRKPVQIAVLA
jgi:8-oxo-dGTP diphosphatase